MGHGRVHFRAVMSADRRSRLCNAPQNWQRQISLGRHFGVLIQNGLSSSHTIAHYTLIDYLFLHCIYITFKRREKKGPTRP